MSDKQAIIELFKRFRLVESKTEDKAYYINDDKSLEQYYPEGAASAIILQTGDGYGGFEGWFYFDKDGKFISHALVE